MSEKIMMFLFFFFTSPLTGVCVIASFQEQKEIQGAALAQVTLSFTPHCDNDKYIIVVMEEEHTSLLRQVHSLHGGGCRYVSRQRRIMTELATYVPGVFGSAGGFLSLAPATHEAVFRHLVGS